MNTTCTGMIKLEIVANVLKQYKEGAAVEQIEQGEELIIRLKSSETLKSWLIRT
jgi:hypothetical protein